MTKALYCLGHHLSLLPSSGDYDLVEGITEPHMPGPPSHYHVGYQELFYVLEGEMEFVLEDKVVVVKTGESLDLPTHTAHTFRNKGETACRWLTLHSPKGFRSFFEKFGVDASQEDALAKSVDPLIIQSVIQQAASYDMHLA